MVCDADDLRLRVWASSMQASRWRDPGCGAVATRHIKLPESLSAFPELTTSSESIAQSLAEVVPMRLGLFERKFMQLTGDAHKAAELAAKFYLALVGCHQALIRPTTPPQLKELLQCLIASDLFLQLRPRPTNRHAVSASGRR